MKFLAILILLISIQCFAQTQSDEVFKTILGYEQALMDGVAVGDKGLWDKRLLDSCLITIEDGSMITKQKMIAELNPLPKGYVGRIQIIEPKFQLYGNTAVISFINDEYLELFKQKIHTQYRQTDTWLKIKGEWKMIAMQLFEIPKNPPPIQIDSNQLAKFRGIYELSDERKCTISLENGKLFAKKGNGEPQELLAETENVFFRKNDGRVRVIFLKTDDGSFKMIERRAGEDLVWKKSK